MRRFARRTILGSLTSLLLPASACLLGPKSVGGDEELGTTSIGGASEDTFVATTNATGADPHGDEVVVCWEDLFPYALAPTAEGDVFALASGVQTDGPIVLARVDDVGELWMIEPTWGRSDTLTVTEAGQLVIGGATADDYFSPTKSEARLWLVADDGSLLSETVVDGTVFSNVAMVAEGGGALWTLTEVWGDETGWSPDLRADLRRHDPDGTTVLTVPFEVSARGLAVGPGGEAYVAVQNFEGDPGLLHRVGLDGAIEWTSPLPFSPHIPTIVRPRPGGGVVVAHQDWPDVHVVAVDDGGLEVASFTAAGASPHRLDVPLDVGAGIILSHGVDPDGLRVERRDETGAVQWSVSRSFPMVPPLTEVNVRVVTSLPSQVVLAGGLQPGPGGVAQGFIRFIDT